MHRKVVISIALTLILLSSMTFADALKALPKVSLTYERALNDALSESLELRELSNGYDALRKGYLKAEEGAKQVGSVYNDLQKYIALHEKLASGAYLQGLDLTDYQYGVMVFGQSKPTLSSEEIYQRYIHTMEVIPFELYYQAANIKEDKRLVESQIKNGVRQLYFGIVALDNTIESIALKVTIQDKQHQDMVALQKQGRISQIDFEKSVIDLMKSQIEIEKLKRTRENMITQLKSMVGISQNQEVILVTTTLPSVDKNLKPFETYYEKATIIDPSLVKAENDLKVVNYKNDRIVIYYKDALLTERIDSQVAVDTKVSAQTLAKIALKRSVYSIYIDALDKQSNFETANLTLQSSLSTLRSTQNYYKLGLVNGFQKYAAEANYESARINYFAELLNLQIAILSLNELGQ